MANDMAAGEVRPQTDAAAELLKEAEELETRAARKARQAKAECCSEQSAVYLERDVGIYRELAAGKRAKAQRLNNAGRGAPQKEECRG